MEFEIVCQPGTGALKRQALGAAPAPQGHEVLVRPRWVGICGSDLYLRHASPALWRPGHEWVGSVEQAGPLARLRAGQLVTSSAHLECGRVLSSPELGALRSWMLLDECDLRPIAESNATDSYALLELLGVGESALELLLKSHPRTPSEVLIFGGGPVGAACALAARGRGIAACILEIYPARVKRLRDLGFTAHTPAEALFLPEWENHFEAMIDSSNDYSGASGTPAYRQIPRFARTDVTAILLGKYLEDQPLPAQMGHLQARLIWMRGASEAGLRRAIDLWPAMRLSEVRGPLVSHVFGVDDIDAAFAMAARRDQAMKVLVDLGHA